MFFVGFGRSSPREKKLIFKFECKDELTSIINTVMIPNYENFLRNIELQKTSIGLNYSKYQQNEKTELLKQKNENLDHLESIQLKLYVLCWIRKKQPKRKEINL